MNCQKFESVAGDLARGQMMEVELQNAAMVHKSDCPSCSSLLRDEERLTHSLRSLAVEMNSLGTSPSGEDRLLSAFRQRQVVVPMPLARDHRRYWLSAVAALFLVVFSLVAIRLQQDDPMLSPQKVMAVIEQSTPKNEVVSTVDQTEPEKGNQVDIGTPRKRTPRVNYSNVSLQARAGSTRNKNNNVAANHVTNEVATDFMPIGYLSASSLQDGGQIVRVELPRSRLASFGIPVNMDRYNERVKADILLGVDGTARAIRFVQEKRLQ